MQDITLKFRHEVIDPNPPGAEHDVTLIADVNGDGRNDIIIGGKIGDPNLFWYENPSWTRHDMASGPDLEAGGVVLDINGDGRLDVIAGQQGRGKELYWFENPPDPRNLWKTHIIDNSFERYHDQTARISTEMASRRFSSLHRMSGLLRITTFQRTPLFRPGLGSVAM